MSTRSRRRAHKTEQSQESQQRPRTGLEVLASAAEARERFLADLSAGALSHDQMAAGFVVALLTADAETLHAVRIVAESETAAGRPELGTALQDLLSTATAGLEPPPAGAVPADDTQEPPALIVLPGRRPKGEAMRPEAPAGRGVRNGR